METSVNGISVIMPTYNQGAFISRAIKSLFLQSFVSWELIIINDGCTDYTEEVVSDLLTDDRVKYLKNAKNKGLGACLNIGIENSSFNYITYLPSDDIYYKNHLQALYDTINKDDEAILSYTGINYNYFDSPTYSDNENTINTVGNYFQLIQVLHKKTEERWMERDELVTDDLNRMFWKKLKTLGKEVPTNEVTCEWVDHPGQRHKIIKENSSGGIYLYKSYYGVKQPIRYQSTVGNYIDEITDYDKFRHIPVIQEHSLKILIVGELAYNAERIFAFEEAGHKLYGLWLNTPHCYNTIGPLPFGNVENIDLDNWIERVKEIKPDVIYALLNYQAVQFAHYIMMTNPGVPFVWHFKEGPFYCRQHGTWKELMELYVNSDGQIYISPEVKEWYGQFLSEQGSCSYILDGDLPKKDWFDDVRSKKLSETDGEMHTVVPGRPFGLHPQHIQHLGKQKIHLHFYGDIQQVFWRSWIESAEHLAPGYLHIHPHCKPENWVKEFSQYDAGWLHYYTSENKGEMLQAVWHDLNYPARMPTLIAAGLPVLQKDNSGHIDASYNLMKKLGMGIFFNSFEDLGEQLRDKNKLGLISDNVWTNRMQFSFDYHIGDLIKFFRKVIADKQQPLQAEKIIPSRVIEQ